MNKKPAIQPLAVALAEFVSSLPYHDVRNPFGTALAAALVLVLPVALLLAIFKRFLTGGGLGGVGKE